MSNDLISRSSLLEELKEQHDYIMQDPEVSKTMKWCEAVCFHRTVETVESAPDVDAGPKWISVKERLPELIPCNAGTAYSEAVIVWTNGRKAMVAVWDGIDFLCAADYWESWGEKITHWMPLPEPPKEG